MPAVYLIHFDRPLAHARHYIGYTKHSDPGPRLAVHRAGAGSRLLAELNRLGIGYRVVRVWPGGTRKLERALKNRKEAHCFCPYCRPKLRANLYRFHHENKGLMTPEEEAFIERLNAAGSLPKWSLTADEKKVAEALAKRGEIKRLRPVHLVHFRTLKNAA